jgi:hypothetical protein
MFSLKEITHVLFIRLLCFFILELVIYPVNTEFLYRMYTRVENIQCTMRSYCVQYVLCSNIIWTAPPLICNVVGGEGGGKDGGVGALGYVHTF